MAGIGSRWVFVLLLASSPVLAAPPKQDASAFQKAMLAEVNQLVSDYNSGDPGKLGTHYASDQMLMVDGAPNLDAAGARKRREQQTSFAITLAVSNIVIDAPASQDMATVRSACIVTVADKSSGKVLMTQANNCLLGYRRQADGTMKVNWGLTVPTVPHTVAPPPPPSSSAR